MKILHPFLLMRLLLNTVSITRRIHEAVHKIIGTETSLFLEANLLA